MSDLHQVIHIDNIRLGEDERSVVIIDQTQLPNRTVYLTLRDEGEMYEAIRQLKVRGAPAIGICAAYCVYALARQSGQTDPAAFAAEFHRQAAYLNSSRPTAVNLSWALRRMENVVTSHAGLPVEGLLPLLGEECRAIHREDIEMCKAISEYGLSLVKDGDGILTHCNAGPLATSRYGTALGPLFLGKERGMEFHVFSDETRPLLQGARLTSYELQKAGIDVTLICDNMASIVMKNGWINACFVGCDRIAANGDTANKIGTSGVAILAKHYGILAFIAAHGDANTVTPVQETTGDPAAAVQTVTDIVADYDVLVCTGFQFAGIATVAQENPEKHFILVDAFPSDANGAEVTLDNIYAMQFAEQESGFFAGIAAAMETVSNKIAVVNAVAYPSNVNYQYGFESGVNYANKNLGTAAEVVELASYAGTDVTGANVGGNYTGNFNDLAAGKAVGQALIQQGCDVIFVAAGDSGNGVFTAAKEAGGVKVIGCDVDQYDDGVNGAENIILTSVLKNMAINVERQLNAVVDGTFAGGNNTLKADTDSTGYVSAEGRQQLSADTLTALAAAYPLVKDGTIVPAANFNGIAPDAFPGL